MPRISQPFFRKLGQAAGQECLSNSGRPLNLYIRKKLKLLKQQLEKSGQRFGFWYKTLPDGTRLEFVVNLNGIKPILLAKVISYLPRDTKELPLLLSGLYAVYYYNLVLGGPIHREEDGELIFDGTGITKAYSFVVCENEKYARTAFLETSHFNKQFDFAGLTDLIDSPLLRPHINSLVDKKSGSFSGTMRRVVQLLAGRQAPILYDYRWPTTHGIYINSAKNTLWVIEVAATGVTAWQLPTMNGKNISVPALCEPLGLVPLEQAELPDSEGRRILADADTISPAYEGSAVTSEIGWAFNKAGSECANVVVKGGFQGQDGTLYEKSFVYKITISADLEGDPISASLSQEGAEEFCWTNRLANNVRVPKWGICGQTHPKHFTSEPTQNPPKLTAFTFPVHCFYEPSNFGVGDSLKIFYYEYTPSENEPAKNEFFGSFEFNSCGFANAFPSVFDSTLAQYVTTPSMLKKYERWPSHTKTSTQIIGIESSLAQPTRSNHEYFSCDVFVKESYGQVVGSGNVGVFKELAVLEKYGYYTASRSTGYYFSFIIPWFEREAVIFVEEFLQDEGNKTIAICRQPSGGITYHLPSPTVGWLYGTIEGCIEETSFIAQAKDGIQDVLESGYVALGSAYFPEGYPIVTGPTARTCGAITWQVYSLQQIISFPYPLTVSTSAGAGTTYQHAASIQYVGNVESLDNAEDWAITLNDGAEDAGVCGIASPIWMGLWLDAFTGLGFATAYPRAHSSATDDNKLIVLGQWGDVEKDQDDWLESALPLIGRVQGWFGIPFPDENPDFEGFL